MSHTIVIKGKAPTFRTKIVFISELHGPARLDKGEMRQRDGGRVLRTVQVLLF